MFGDFEAQRHWMELTVNLPVNEWFEKLEYIKIFINTILCILGIEIHLLII